ncbi:16S rRNA (cytosine(1402)-N(4))-methyltransferase RsmH [Phyllobacterium sp. 21LDTY02-6]|uniref:16S rRNA (cytosine(1402)-N(4))-methyltransferase RsmH n=1 Tax=unclassified Phyllobacterium TaxID=2638441 RepID=UPI00202295EB|nr:MULTISPECIES: 16S rRNA (cytosine(1402)-N(4))-methyltransferase RsmH [unclassified Phyllobacterium]MCO4315966.1 16S rRNA (cytosine(1402)-N(4))-methyltransferase RsmH [Phyllobacterium sp. 21LDTY02-6]MCX8279610.1 16S rRNA (cytosine(1402)-N(4))-methyltransferase RsmH [Phyllobacterium sp. 0TCS1.6C]MCX8292199.1 16S rRNA (cytosine(1402)-N(4))-methyltransferase RsmH [Phyllobacterium sp. 0TCS1.6A]
MNEAADDRHIPVLIDEVIAALRPGKGTRIIDGTFGAGGYTKRILETGAEVIAIDRDPSAIAAGRQLEKDHAGRLTLVQGTFSTLDQVALLGAPDGIVLDIGVSSMQLDEAERGFSFQKDGPLDMRMSSAGASAADVVNRFKTGDLARIFNFLGEERQAGRIARMIEKRRASEPFERTRDLANAIEALVGRNPKVPIHPATRVFQALRIFVNDELGELVRALHAAERVLKPGGRLVVVTFHSLEDRIVKRFFADRAGAATGSRHLPQVEQRLASFTPIGKGIVTPGETELARNPRSRSAKLRAGERTDNPPLAEDHSIYGLPQLPQIHETARN